MKLKADEEPQSETDAQQFIGTSILKVRSSGRARGPPGRPCMHAALFTRPLRAPSPPQRFEDGLDYSGVIKSVDFSELPAWYRVAYEDGQMEDFEWPELCKHADRASKKAAAKRGSSGGATAQEEAGTQGETETDAPSKL